MSELPEIVATKKYSTEDLKNLEGEMLFKSLTAKEKENEMLEKALHGGKGARIQYKENFLGRPRFTVVIDAHSASDIKFLKGIVLALKNWKRI